MLFIGDDEVADSFRDRVVRVEDANLERAGRRVSLVGSPENVAEVGRCTTRRS